MTDGPKKDGIEGFQLFGGGFGQHLPGFQISVAAEVKIGHIQFETEFVRCCFQRLFAFGNDFRTGAVPRDDCDFVCFSHNMLLTIEDGWPENSFEIACRSQLIKMVYKKRVHGKDKLYRILQVEGQWEIQRKRRGMMEEGRKCESGDVFCFFVPHPSKAIFHRPSVSAVKIAVGILYGIKIFCNNI